MTYKYEYYVASRWRNKDIVLELIEKLRAKGKSTFSFFEGKEQYSVMQGNPEEAMKRYEALSNWTNDPAVRAMFQIDMEALKNSENLVLLLPAGKSSHIEAGIAYGLGRTCILVGEPPEAESLYLIFSDMYPTIDKFIKNLN